jgi:hypothetical protein
VTIPPEFLIQVLGHPLTVMKAGGVHDPLAQVVQKVPEKIVHYQVPAGTVDVSTDFGHVVQRSTVNATWQGTCCFVLRGILVVARESFGPRAGGNVQFYGKSSRRIGPVRCQEATKRLHSMWTLAIVAMAVIGAILGFMLRASFPWFTLLPASGLLLTAVLLLLLGLVGSATFRRLDELEKERDNMRKGASGENAVGLILSKLPDEFCVVNDVSTPTGNLDHVVVGPTGVFVIETKNCRGVIGADGKGELTLNGKPSKKRHASRLVGRMMGARDRVLVLAPGVDPFFNAVMVFTSAWVDAKFGTTGKAYCLRDDRLAGYIVDHKPGKKLSAEDVASIAQAFASLARIDPDFRAQTARASGEGSEASGCAAGARG